MYIKEIRTFWNIKTELDTFGLFDKIYPKRIEVWIVGIRCVGSTNADRYAIRIDTDSHR